MSINTVLEKDDNLNKVFIILHFVTTLDTIPIYIQKLCRQKYINHVAVETEKEGENIATSPPVTMFYLAVVYVYAGHRTM